MKRLSVLASFVLILGVSASGFEQATTGPGPEVKKLAMFVGTWLYEGTAEKTPLGPAAKVSGKQTGQLLAKGYAVQWTGEETGAFGGVQWGEVDTYDEAAKNYPFQGYQSDGTTWSGVSTVSGTTWKNTGIFVIKGTRYSTRSEFAIAADGKTATWKAELSTDGGKTWMPWQAQKLTKQ